MPAARSLRLACLALALTGCFDDATLRSPDAGPVDDIARDARPDAVDAPDDVAPDASAPVDAPAPDASDLDADVPAADAPDDAAPDAPAPDAMRCGADSDCTDPAAPRCDTAAGRCVRCLASADCPRAQRCDDATRACLEGCGVDDDCRRGADDAGTAPPSRCDTRTRRCVECTTDDECPMRQVCTDQACVPGCNDRRPCGAGETCCGGACVDVSRNSSHCGMCGRRCEAANAVPACGMGACVLDACTEGFFDCNGSPADGCEVNTRSDADNCGSCGRACSDVANAATTCTAGRCGFTCSAGFADCNDVGADGCERNLRTDVAHCGMCGRACPVPAGASAATCAMGACGFTCMPGMADCDGNAANGCEVDTRSATAHCGMCGSACPSRPHATPVCAAGRCGLRCDTGFGDCDGMADNGCETALDTAVEHCGRCGNRCSAPGGTPACVRGACAVASCGGDFADCDMSPGNGCETDLRATAAHCGACGRACPTASNATASCEARTCSSRCNTGFGDCDGNSANGCETNLNGTPAHCGACGRACSVANGSAGCGSGQCTIATCNAGFADCDRLPANGCEINLATSVANCGACGVRGTEVCDGRDNNCDGRVDEGCPTGLANVDGVDFTGPLMGVGSGSAFDLGCPAGAYVTGVSGRLYSSYYNQSWTFRCARPRFVEDRTRTPYTYRVEWDGTTGTGTVPNSLSGTAFAFDCPAGSVVHRLSLYGGSSFMGQATWECASWAITGSPTAGFRIERSVTRSASYGLVRGSRYDYSCPNEGANASAVRSVFGRYSGVYMYGAGLRCTAPSVTVR